MNPQMYAQLAARSLRQTPQAQPMMGGSGDPQKLGMIMAAKRGAKNQAQPMPPSSGPVGMMNPRAGIPSRPSSPKGQPAPRM